MRALWPAAALMLLSGCQDDYAPKPDDTADAPAASDGFAYRYAFALPAARLKSAAQVHADACTRLGPDRCRITGLRYRLGDDNRAHASLTVRIDPALARPFADAIVKSVTDASGTLAAFEIAAPEMRSAADTALIRQLREAKRTARAAGRDGAARATRLQAALDTIADVEAEQPGISVAFDYRSTQPLSRFGSSGLFRNAGEAFVNSSGRLLEFLATIGPWLLGLVVLLLGLNWLGRRGKRAPQLTPAVPVSESAPRKSPSERENVMRRWFAAEREDGEIVHI
ncbi:hypothetical protein AB2M62_05470 [Sphingomonas sp. MMS12-HWE2-04]|uniref:hypothetical protein n=1 Tax=Sphingomonas sp. MMS12-HWE2-04 TaxID=3234199 RepID=UPI00384EEEA9